MHSRLSVVALMVLGLATIAHAQWIQTNGPWGANVLTVATSGGGVFAGTEEGVYRSTDNGGSWVPVNTGLTTRDVTGLVFNGTDLFAGIWGGGMFRSSDNGDSWTELNDGLDTYAIQAIAVDGINAFVATYGWGVYRSTDNGAHWTRASGQMANKIVLALAMSGTKVFAGTRSDGVFLSTDNGLTWTPIGTGMIYPSITALAVMGTTLFAGSFGGGSVYRSTDDGASWQVVNNGMGNRDVRCLMVCGSNLIAGTTEGVYITSNQGESWRYASSGIAKDLWVTGLGQAGTTLFAVGHGGAFRSTDNGITWTVSNVGLKFAHVQALEPRGTHVFAGTSHHGVAVSRDGGVSWTTINEGLTYPYVTALLANEMSLFAGTAGMSVFRSTDDGANWSPGYNGMPTGFHIYDLATSGPNTLVAANYGMYRSIDNGISGMRVTEVPQEVGAITAIGNSLFACTFYDGVFASTDDGASWAVTGSSHPPKIRRLIACGTDLYAGTMDDGIFLSTDAGASWTEVNNGVTFRDIRAFAVYQSNVFAGTSGGGVLLSTNRGSSWTPVNEGLGWFEIDVLTVSGANLLTGTRRNGVWLRPISEMIPKGEVAGTVTSAGAGLVGVTVDLFDGDNRLTQQAVTGEAGAYRFRDLVTGEYSVMVVEPLGYKADENPKLVTVVPGATTVADFTLAKSVILNSARGKGYWRHQFDVAVDGKGAAQEPVSGLSDYVTNIQEHYSPHFSIFANTVSLGDWLSVLSSTRRSEMVDRAEEQIAALLLNLVSLKLGQYTTVSTDGRTAGDVLTYVSRLVTDETPANDELAKDLAEKVNSQELIEARLVPAGSCLYKVGQVGQAKRIEWIFGIPKEYGLEQNYPNPFNPSTTIRFGLPQASSVRLSVMNTLGQEVATILEGEKAAGQHVVSFDASGLSSGVYFYRLRAGAYVQTRRCLVVR